VPPCRFVAEIAGPQGGTASSFFINSLDLAALPKRRRGARTVADKKDALAVNMT